MRWGIAVLAVCALAAPVAADNDKDIAAKLFKQGRALMDAGKLDEACARFEESLRLDPQAIGTKLNLADCWEKKGRLADAYRLFDEAAVTAAKESKEGRESFARQRADALVKKLVRIELRIEAPADGMTIELDGHPLGKAAWGKPQLLAPGTIVIEASAQGRTTYKTVIDGVAGEVRIIDVPVLERASGGTDATGAGTGTSGAGGTGTGVGTGDGTDTGAGGRAGAGAGTGTGGVGSEGRPRSRTPAYVVGGIGVAMLGTSLALGLAARSKFNGAECGDKAMLPDNRCTPAGQATTDNARRLADIGTGVAIAGAVAVGVGVYLFVRARGKRDRVVVAPAVSDTGVGVVVTVFE